MKQLEYLNRIIKEEVAAADNCVLFGQNINAGSCLGGLTRNIVVNVNSRIINTTNAENSLAGFGFGLMMNGMSGVFLMKQLDFLLLSIDQLVNTYNIIRSIGHQPANGSFTIVATVVDSGYDGPQSSFNNLYDICSIARISGFTVTNKADIDHLFSKQFVKPGFRIIALSQRLAKVDIEEITSPVNIIADGDIFQYTNGSDTTIVSSNFSYPQAAELTAFLEEKGVHASHFHVNSVAATDWKSVIDSVTVSKKLVLIDDSKSLQTPAHILLESICNIEGIKKIILKRELGKNWLHPVSDIFDFDKNAVLSQLQVG